MGGERVRFDFRFDRLLPGMYCTFTIYDQQGLPVATFSSNILGPDDVFDPALENRFICEIGELPLLPGRYRINVAALAGRELLDHLEGVITFDVDHGRMGGRAIPNNAGYGSVSIAHQWSSPAALGATL